LLVNFDCMPMATSKGGGLIFHGANAPMRRQPRYTELPDLKDVTQEIHSTHDGAIEHVQNFLDCIRSRNTPNA
jgi:hypothetical protein